MSLKSNPHFCTLFPLPALTSSPFLCHSFILSSPLYCEMWRGREGRGRRCLLLAFRWFHMKSHRTHLGCRQWQPKASQLLPLSIPVRPCTSTSTGHKPKRVYEYNQAPDGQEKWIIIFLGIWSGVRC